jgi:hypothetical protein
MQDQIKDIIIISGSHIRSHRSFRIATITASHLEFRLSSLIDAASHRRVRELRLLQFCGSASRLHTGKNPHDQYHYLHHVLSFMPVRFQKEKPLQRKGRSSLVETEL